MSSSIALKRAGKSQAAVAMVASQRGRIMMDQVRRLITTQLNSLAQRRVELRAEITASLQYNTVLGLGASMASFVIICFSIVVAASSLSQRAEATTQAELLAETNAMHAHSAVRRATYLSATAQMLQSIDSIKAPAELSHVLPIFMSKLLPNTSGQVYLYGNSRDFLEMKAYWGSKDLGASLLAPSDCWGLRLGKIHHSTPTDLCCEHTDADDSAKTQFCVPMMSQGDVVGLLVVTDITNDSALIDQDIVATLAEQLALAINNVLLRDSLRQQSTIDPLTGLYNRRYFDETLRRELIRAQRSQTSCSVIMIDLDHFKRINDTYGHDAGDLVLENVSRKIVGCVRASDVVCRYGGEELVVVLPDCTVEAAAVCAEKIRQSLAEISIHHLGQHISGITASFGISSCPSHGERNDEILKAADRALYIAKNNGRDQVLIAEPYGEKVVVLSSRARST
ncbi:diguanylate cyclase [Massilia sp. RP-1-19]|uniref:diguanylate cyclase n=2 Tax=Massilia polaris TaxID=2728846 RepID=A0A848HNQ5_9BURK|nr:diguanylate cyclase [Massilia polaris]